MNEGVLLTGQPAWPPTPLGSGCVSYIDLSAAPILVPFTLSGGVATLGVHLPMVPGLVDLCVPLQAALGSTSTSQWNVDLTNAIYAVPDVR